MERWRARQRAALLRQREKPVYPGYLLVFSAIIILMRVSNELASNLAVFVQSPMVEEFYCAGGMGFEEGLARFTALKLGASAVAVLTVFYKPLADRLGRKAVLVANAVGTAAGMLCCYWSPNAAALCAGIACCTFFTQNDLQMMYILETAPRAAGGRLFGVIKSFGILGLLLVPLLRDTVMNNDPARWRQVYFIPTLFCAGLAVLLALFTRESPLFIQRRLALLEQADAPAEPDTPTASTASDEKTPPAGPGLRGSVGYVLRTPALRAALLAYTFYGFCAMAAYSYVEPLMTTNGMSTQAVTRALYVYPFVYAGLSFAAGFAADRLGRKPVVATAGLAVAAGFVLFLLACKNGWPPLLVGLLNGVYLGGYWVCGDYLSILFLEEVPTELRASVLSGASLLMMAGCVLGVAAQMGLMLLLGLNAACLLLLLPCSIGCVLLVLFRVRETAAKAGS